MLDVSFFLLGLNVSSVIASGDFTIGEMDAVNGVFTLNGAPCAIEDIIDLASPDISFDPLQDIDSGGVKPRDGSGRVLPIKEPLYSTILAGSTAVFDVTFDDSSSVEIHFHDADYNLDAYVSFNDANFELFAADGADVFTVGANSPGAHRVAITATPNRMAISFDGGAVSSHEHGAINEDVTAIQFAIGGLPLTRLRSFAFYTPQSDADLPTLSAL